MAFAGTLALGGCLPRPCPPPGLPSSEPTTALIDGHCHLFNAKDLSTVRFLSYVVAKHYPKQADVRALTPEDPDGVDLFMAAVLSVVGADRAPSAVTELRLLQGVPTRGRGGEDIAPEDRDKADQALVARVADFLGGRSYLPQPTIAGQARAEAQLRELLLRAGGADRAVDARGVAPLSAEERLAIAKRALSRDAAVDVTPKSADLANVNLPGLFEFVKQLKRFRHCVVDELTELHRKKSGLNPLLVAPAMVDFGRWLRDDPAEGSTFVQQTEVWRAIGRRRGGPAVHGYVAFCPLRQVEYRRRRFGPDPGQIQTACGDVEPLALVESALKTKGFIGVKVYPPMGFRAAKNALRGPDEHPYPEAVLKDVFGRSPGSDAERLEMSRTLGEELDQALGCLYDLCAGLGAPIMAHGGNSVGANCDTGELADPFYWREVFERTERPPVMLAHFGSFAYWSADPDAPKDLVDTRPRCERRGTIPPFESTWEAWLARYLQRPENRHKPIFADMSYFSEALSTGGEAAACANFKELQLRYPGVMRDHLVFGTDWVMLAQEKHADVYGARVRNFVRATFGPDAVEPIMRTNFLRYAGLAKDSRTFARISSIYDGDATLMARLQAACA